jgi:hypothetical protein
LWGTVFFLLNLDLYRSHGIVSATPAGDGRMAASDGYVLRTDPI